MSDLGRLLDPNTIAIAGLSAHPAKHGGRVLGHLRKLGFTGEIWGVNPSLPTIEGVDVYRSVADLPAPPDLVVCAVPAAAAVDVIADCAGVGSVVVFAGGFAESGPDGRVLQGELARQAAEVGARVLGPNSGGVIRPGRALAASFLTCLDRPPDEIRSGPVAVVTQSGGIGSYLHNLAAGRAGGLAVSLSTGNEEDIKLGEAIDAVSRLDEVQVVLTVVETVRDGKAFMEAIESAHSRGKAVVACRLGTGRHGKTLMTSHTGAMAVPEAVLEGVLESVGVVVAETPAEAYEVAELMAGTALPGGGRAAIITHSGGMAILLADLAERHGLELRSPGDQLKTRLDPLLDHGAANNPLDMGGIIGGPARFAEVVDAFAGAGDFDMLLAVSTAHPPAHTDQRVASLLALDTDVPVLQLWMAGDQAAHGLRVLRDGGAAVTEEPRAAMRALAGLGRLAARGPRRRVEPHAGALEDWGLPLIERRVVSTAGDAAEAADDLGYPVVVKVESPGLAHKTEAGGVRVGLVDRDSVILAYREVVGSAESAGLPVSGARVERFRPGLEMIIGALVDDSFGPIVSVGLGGIFTELMRDVVFSPAPVDEGSARAMVGRLRGKRLLDGFRGDAPAHLDELARIISVVSRGLVGSGLSEVEINPLTWDGSEWVAVDWMTVRDRATAS
jgi:acetate---CoA ligase (ADP-forming)